MTLSQILVFVVFALLVALLRRGPGQIQAVQRLSLTRWLLLGGSVLAIYWMQPSMPVRYLDFWLPTGTLGLVALVWAATVVFVVIGIGIVLDRPQAAPAPDLAAGYDQELLIDVERSLNQEVPEPLDAAFLLTAEMGRGSPATNEH